jgi:uroporphyrinogen-III synthase
MPDNAAPLILLTRPRAASERFAASLRAAIGGSLRIVCAPLMEIRPIPPLPDLAGVGGVIFTSEVAVRLMAEAPVPEGLVAWCVGDRTCAAAHSVGFDARSAGGTADDLVRTILAARPAGTLLHLHGLHTRGDVAGRVRHGGLPVTAQAIYRQDAAPVPDAFSAALAQEGVILAPLFSPRSARLFVQAADGNRPPKATLVAISGAVRDALPSDWQAACRVAPEPNGAAIITTLAGIISSHASVDGPRGVV